MRCSLTLALAGYATLICAGPARAQVEADRLDHATFVCRDLAPIASYWSLKLSGDEQGAERLLAHHMERSECARRESGEPYHVRRASTVDKVHYQCLRRPGDLDCSWSIAVDSGPPDD